jgi:hypothetical protein
MNRSPIKIAEEQRHDKRLLEHAKSSDFYAKQNGKDDEWIAEYGMATQVTQQIERRKALAERRDAIDAEKQRIRDEANTPEAIAKREVERELNRVVTV